MKEFCISNNKLEEWKEAFNNWMDTKYTPTYEMLDDYALKNIGKTDGQFFRAFVSGHEYAKQEQEHANTILRTTNNYLLIIGCLVDLLENEWKQGDGMPEEAEVAYRNACKVLMREPYCEE